MTLFEQELRRLFDHDTVFADARFAGNVCYGRLNEDVRIKARFVTCGCADNYEALKVTLINRREGEIDSSLLKFRDLWGMKKVNNLNFREGVSPHMWVYNGKAEWYAYTPGEADRQQLKDAVQTYLSVFQEPVQEQQMEQKMC